MGLAGHPRPVSTTDESLGKWLGACSAPFSGWDMKTFGGLHEMTRPTRDTTRPGHVLLDSHWLPIIGMGLRNVLGVTSTTGPHEAPFQGPLWPAQTNPHL